MRDDPEITSWDVRFMRLALEARSWVKGPDLGVGACVVSPDRRGFSLGYSGLPRGMEDTHYRITHTWYKDLHCVHAELNAILNASRSVVGWTLYSTTAPCSHCAAAIVQAGIARVVSPRHNTDRTTNRWLDSQVEGTHALRECGVQVDRMELP